MNAIMSIMSIISLGTATFFAVSAWFALRRMLDDVRDMKRGIAITTAMTMASNVKSNFDEVNKMRAALARLVESERYEEARELKAEIAEAEHNANKLLQRYKDVCGEGIVEIVVKQARTEEGYMEEE